MMRQWRPRHNDLMRFLQIIGTIFGLIVSSGAALELTKVQVTWCGIVGGAAWAIHGILSEQAMKEALHTRPPMPPLQVPPWVRPSSRTPRTED